MSQIIYTLTDEAPALATRSLLPVIQRFSSPLGIHVKQRDISVASRILAQFPDYLDKDQRVPDELAALGELAKTPQGIIIKLPNISASIPQLVEAIAELQEKGFNIPNFNNNPTTEKEVEERARYGKVLGSAVNPVLREGNSDRRVAPPVKEHAKKMKERNPKMRAWSETSKTHVASMKDGDYFGSELSHVMEKAGGVKIELIGEDGKNEVLKEKIGLEKGEVIDACRISVKALKKFYEDEMVDCFDKGLMISLHLKATMMKVSDPILFGHCVKVYFKDVFEKHTELFHELGVNPNNGLGDVYDKIKGHPKQSEIESDIAMTYSRRPGLAMVDSSKGITNLHVPSDVIIDASMPCVVRDGGMMWNKDDQLEEVKCLVPDRSYGAMYNAVMEDCKSNGQFDWTTMGNVSNVGLMAKKAEEYGSHDKTFEIERKGRVVVTEVETGDEVFSHEVEVGDIWRMCQVKDEPIRDWVKLAVARAKATGAKTIFWLDPVRAHDTVITKLAKKYLLDHDTTGCDITFATPVEALKESCARARAGQDTISVTGNVLRDYLTDLFPILELGTSAKMLSIVPLLAGGALLETGAGGSAPKHVQQFVKEGHLRWDSLGEYLATAIAFQELGARADNEKAKDLGDALMEAVGVWLEQDKAPGRKVKQVDNRASNFYLALYWASAMADRDASFKELASQLKNNESVIVKELLECQGEPVNVGGYYILDEELADAAMRPSKVFNQIIDNY